MAQASDGRKTGPPADALVIFGITGDLAKKMTFKALYSLFKNGTLDVPVIGVARNDWTDDQCHDHAREAIESASEEGAPEIDEDVFKKFKEKLSYVPGDYGEKDTYERLKKKLSFAKHPVFYLEIPPALFAPVIEQLGSVGLTDGGPGRDREALRPRP